jgi:hypothetical protein
MAESLTIFATGTEVKLKNYKHLTAFIEKAIIGEHNTIQYQLIVYAPERGPLLVNAFEVESAGISKKHKLGFHPIESGDTPKRVEIIIDENRCLVDINHDPDVIVEIIETKTSQKEETDE